LFYKAQEHQLNQSASLIGGAFCPTLPVLSTDVQKIFGVNFTWPPGRFWKWSFFKSGGAFPVRAELWDSGVPQRDGSVFKRTKNGLILAIKGHSADHKPPGSAAQFQKVPKQAARRQTAIIQKVKSGYFSFFDIKRGYLPGKRIICLPYF
jgi:hypothetical protein